jgi:hypothetical protein
MSYKTLAFDAMGAFQVGFLGRCWRGPMNQMWTPWKCSTSQANVENLGTDVKFSMAS